MLNRFNIVVAILVSSLSENAQKMDLLNFILHFTEFNSSLVHTVGCLLCHLADLHNYFG